jgi:uncharacterized protein (TIGR03067 family)
MRRFLLAVGFVAASLSLVAQDPPRELAKPTEWDGYWKPLSVIADDEEQMKSAETKAMITLVVKDGEHRLFVLKDAVKDLHYRLSTSDLTVNPEAKTFELSVKQGQKKGEKLHGIYELTEQTLRVCYGPAAKPRPTGFKAPKGSECFLETWVREKKK